MPLFVHQLKPNKRPQLPASPMSLSTPSVLLLTSARSYVSVGVAYLGNRRSLRAAMCLYLPRCKYFHWKVTCVHIFSRLADCYFVRSCTLLRQPV